MLRRILGGAVAAAVIGGLSIFTTQPAYAAYTYIQVCNSTDGNAGIRVWKTDSGYSNWLYPTGECTGDLYNGNNSVRVDTRESESYKIKNVTGDNTYGPCHSAEKIDSDPPNGAKVYYKTYLFSNSCSGS